MPIVSSCWANVWTAGGGGTSNVVTWRFATPVTLTAQAAMSGHGGYPVEVGFSAFVAGGQFHPIGDEHYGSRAPTLFMDRVTQVDVEARSWDGWVSGGASGYVWT